METNTRGNGRHGLGRVAGAFAVAIVLAPVSACRATTEPATATATSPSPIGAVFTLDRAVIFTNLDQLAQHSSVVAIVRTTPRVEVIQDPVNFIYTLRTVEVLRAVRGTTEGAHLVVRQPARDGDTLTDLPPHLAADTEYLLFLDRFHTSEGAVADDYLVTGLSGQFAKTAPDSYRRQDPLSTELPETISAADVLAAVARTAYEPALLATAPS